MKCKQCGKEVNQVTKGLCSRHYYQLRTYGKCLDKETKLYKKQLNDIVIHDDYVDLILTDNKNNIVAKVKIDLDLIHKIKDRWSYARKDNHIVNRKLANRLEYYLHNVNRETHKIVYINGDVLDFRRSNIKVITLKEYKLQFKHKKNTSGVNGVSYCSSYNKWKAKITVDSRLINLGTFSNKEDAIKSRKEAELKYF